MSVSDSRRVPIFEIDLCIPGAAFRADEMLGHLRRRYTLRQAKAPGIGIEMPLRAGMTRNDLEETRFSR